MITERHNTPESGEYTHTEIATQTAVVSAIFWSLELDE